jgi:hypothetical protein
MLYDAASQTLIQVVFQDYTGEDLRRFAAIKGSSTEGRPIRQVALVFVQGMAHAEQHLEMIKRVGLECRAIVAGEERVLFAGTTEDSGVSEGTLLPLLREESWAHVTTV